MYPSTQNVGAETGECKRHNRGFDRFPLTPDVAPGFAGISLAGRF